MTEKIIINKTITNKTKTIVTAVKNLPGIIENKVLAPLTSYGIGGPAVFYLEAKNEKDLIRAAVAAKECGLPFFVLGGGSNILVSDKGFRGLVVRTKNSGIAVNKIGQGKTITVGSGTRLSDLAGYFLENSLVGMEWAAGIPGTVGGAIRGNAGAMSGSMADVVSQVNFFDVNGLAAGTRSFPKKECFFSYRDSIFKNKINLVIVSCGIAGKKGKAGDIKKKMGECLAKKLKSQPYDLPSAGSIFKNPKDMFAAKLIDECGLKGRKIGGAIISDKHANFIINAGGATSSDVKKLIALAKKEVFKKFNVKLEEEIEIVG